MLVTAILEAAALVAMLVAVAVFSSMKLKKSRRRAVVAVSLAAGMVFLAAALVINGGTVFQEKAAVNLHLPGSARTKARFWLKEHENLQPDRTHVANNVRILNDGLTFYRAYGDDFSPEAKLRMEEYAKLPPKIAHVLSIAEEARYYEAAQGIFTIMRALAAGPPEGAPSVDADMIEIPAEGAEGTN
jgi:hypothetical protein